MTDQGLCAAIAEKVLGIPVRTGEPSEAEYADILQRAVDAKLVLKQSGSYKGVSYGAEFDGWFLSYHIGHSDSYRASDSITLEEPVDEWKGYDGVLIDAAPIPNFLTWEGIGLIVEAMRAKGWAWHIRCYEPPVVLAGFTYRNGAQVEASHVEAPSAVAFAALKALEA